VINHVTENKVLRGYPRGEAISNDQLLEIKCDILAPCALDGVINKNNVDKIQAKIVVEGANGPCTGDAAKRLAERDILNIPDILANGGGVIVSYFEWVQGLAHFFWNEDEVNQKMKTIITGAFDKVWDLKVEKKIDMRTAAMASAVRRLERAMLLRGLYPR
jgi:glutamate dehydrogenase (NAD(P)+)